MKKIKKLPSSTFKGTPLELLKYIFAWCSQMFNKINELIEEVNRLNRVNTPITDLDNPENNCMSCKHVHSCCACGCQKK